VLETDPGQVTAPLANDFGFVACEVNDGRGFLGARPGIKDSGNLVFVPVADVVCIVERVGFAWRY